jgi:hypothetical protein
MTQSGLFSDESVFPRRYYDDLVLEQELAKQQSQREKELALGVETTNIPELLNSKIPFGMPSARSFTKDNYAGKKSLPNFMPGHYSSQFIPS